MTSFYSDDERLAEGILKERFSLDERAAFALLVESSQESSIKLREVATRRSSGVRIR